MCWITHRTQKSFLHFLRRQFYTCLKFVTQPSIIIISMIVIIIIILIVIIIITIIIAIIIITVKVNVKKRRIDLPLL